MNLENIILFILFVLLLIFTIFISLILITRILFFYLHHIIRNKDPDDLQTLKVPLVMLKKPFAYYQKHPHLMHTYMHRLELAKEKKIHYTAHIIDVLFHFIEEMFIYKIYVFLFVILTLVISIFYYSL